MLPATTSSAERTSCWPEDLDCETLACGSRRLAGPTTSDPCSIEEIFRCRCLSGRAVHPSPGVPARGAVADQ